MSPLLTLFLVLICIVNGEQVLTPEEQQLDEWIASLDQDTLNYYKEYQPYRLRTHAENIRISDEDIANLRASTPYGVYFSGAFTNNTVLQREPHYSSIYGGSNTANTEVTVTMIDNSDSSEQEYKITTMNNGDWKLLLSKTYPNGGNFTFNVSCPQCYNASTKPFTFDTIYNVTFGDVYFCAGQSNMELPMLHTFSRNYTYDNITQLGKYSNIRFFMKQAQTPSQPMWVYPRNDVQNGRYQWHQSTEIDQLSNMASPCWYFAQVLDDKYSMTQINFGMLSTAVGGSLIEAWTKNYTIPYYCADTLCPGPACGGLYNGQLMPFINMTIKAALWYQGENDVGHYPTGSSLNNTGYGCMEPLMLNQWRTNFSIVANTTDEMFPFGVVTLAAQTSEGHQINMSSFRWAQSANYDILPNPVMPNTFIAQGYDIGDPWGNKCSPNCYYPAPYNLNETHPLDGPIHPRPKIYVGQRLARGAAKFIYNIDQIWAGPLIESCTLDDNNGVITVNFNESMLYDEKVIIQPFVLWYNNSITANHTTALQVLIGDEWMYVDDEGVKKNSNNDYSITIDVTAFTKNNQQISGLRYAWEDTPCCGDLNMNKNPCPMNSCRIVTSQTLLPASPFWAQVIDGKCKCFPPQQCG